MDDKWRKEALGKRIRAIKSNKEKVTELKSIIQKNLLPF